jgi:hypothetical protein
MDYLRRKMTKSRNNSLFSIHRNIEKEARNWWALANLNFYELDKQNEIPKNIFKKIKNKKYSDVKDLIKLEIKNNKAKYQKNFEWIKEVFLPEFQKKEKEILERLDKIHNKKFPAKFVKLYFTSIGLGFYGGEKNGFWINISGNPQSKDYWTEFLIHELMHLYFGVYYRKICFNECLGLNEIEDIKESFTILINLEFKDVISEEDVGYGEHKLLREFIQREWKKKKSFEKVLLSTIKFYKNSK